MDPVELGFIGFCVIGRGEVLGVCEGIPLRHITHPTLRDIYREIRVLHKQGKYPDATLLTSRLERKYRGIEHVIERCVASIGDVDHVEVYADRILLRAQRSEYRDACDRFIVETNKDIEADGAVDRLTYSLDSASKVFQPRTTQREIYTEVTADMARGMEAYRNGITPGVPSGYKNFDDETGGFTRGIHIVGGHESSGKSSLVTGSIVTWMRREYKALIISLDMGYKPIVWRVCSHMYDIPIAKFPRCSLGDNEYKMLQETCRRMESSGIMIDPDCSTIIDVRQSLIRNRDLYDIAVIDYLQKIDTDARTEDEAVRRAMLGLSTVQPAIGHKPLIILTQLSNDPSKEELKDGECPVPNLTQLRKFKDIKRMAETVTIVWRRHHGVTEPRGEDAAAFNLCKSQNTGTKMLPQLWEPDFARFTSLNKQGRLEYGT